MRTILWFEEITAEDGDQVGSKALNLAEIARRGFLVPGGFCITTAAYRHFVTANGLEAGIHSVLSLPASQAEEAASRLQGAIRAAHVSPEMRKAILDAYQELTTGRGTMSLPVAVRSSATAEDLPTASFAGQQATLLNVRDQQQLLRAILECWASLWSSLAVLYRAQRGLAQQWPEMAVLVQSMVDAEAAGVAFSLHPVSGEAEVLVEAALGLGETVVSGEGDVDQYSVDRETCREVRPPSIGHKLQKRVMAAQGGLHKVEVPAEMRDARTLSPQRVGQVAEAVLALEQHLGCPQDMEWAFAGGELYILQSRPITTSARSFFTDILPGDEHIWTSGFLNERFPSPVSPLGWSVIQELLEDLAFRDPLRYLGLKGVERLRITRLYRGHPYVNMFVFQTLYKVFPDSLLPEDAYRYFPDGKTELRRQVRYPRSLIDPRFLLSMARHFLQQPTAWSPWHNHRVWAGLTVCHERGSQELVAELQVLRKGDAEVQRIWTAIDKAQQLNAGLLSLHRWSLMHAGLAYTLLRRFVRAWAQEGDAGDLSTRLVTGLPNKSLEIDGALHNLAQITEPAAFAEALDAFLIRYGHRSFHLDIFYPSFVDEPAQVIDLVEHLRHETSRFGEARAAVREQAQRTIRNSLGSGPCGWLKRALLDHVLYLAQRYMPLREEQRFYWQRTLAIMRSFLLLLGERMAKASALNHYEHIFFLTKAEIEAYVHGRVSGHEYSVLAATRQQQFARLHREFNMAPARAYPPFLRGNQPLEVTRCGRETQFKGRAVSPGLARGQVVVLFSPAEFSRVRAGDVLVTHSVDPGWTPIFGLLSALVIEHGGQLSHGAVVAREYGLPAVAGIPGVTQLLHDGDTVVVDGLNGVVIKITADQNRASGY
jgi:phosphohistidine swiveling domain-containing protein